MLGRFCTVSSRNNQTDVSCEDPEAIRGCLSDYACPECGAQQYHLVFRVEALSHRVTLAIACDACSVRTNLPTDGRGRKKPYTLEIVTGQDFDTSHR